MNDLVSLARFLLARSESNGNPGGLIDECAVIANPSGSGHLLFAASSGPGDSWLAGYAAVIAGFSEIAAMGGRPIAVAGLQRNAADEFYWEGIVAAAGDYRVPIVRRDRGAHGAMALGHAGERLIDCRGAEAGDILVMVVDLHGDLKEGGIYWNAQGRAEPARLRAELELLPSLAEKGLCRASRRVGNSGIIGALEDICLGSGIAAVLDLEALPCPMDMEMGRWLLAIPSFGYLLAIAPEDTESTLSHFTATRITCRVVGRFQPGIGITLTADGQSVALDHAPPQELVGVTV